MLGSHGADVQAQPQMISLYSILNNLLTKLAMNDDKDTGFSDLSHAEFS